MDNAGRPFPQPANKLSAEQRRLFLAEYQALRSEIIKRIEIQHQLISLALIAPGTVLAVGIQANDALLVLLYPLFAMFLSAAWSHNGRRAWQIGGYIESQIVSLGIGDIMRWEKLIRRRALGHRASLNFLASRGIFIGTQLIALCVGVSLARVDQLIAVVSQGTILSLPQLGQISAGVLGGASVIMTWALLRPHRADAGGVDDPSQVSVR